MTKKNFDLFECGLNFRKAVLEKGVPPENFKSLLRDVCSEHDELMPALLDLTTRLLFKDLPLQALPPSSHSLVIVFSAKYSLFIEMELSGKSWNLWRVHLVT